jgi:hypothetical protein
MKFQHFSTRVLNSIKNYLSSLQHNKFPASGGSAGDGGGKGVGVGAVDDDDQDC